MNQFSATVEETSHCLSFILSLSNKDIKYLVLYNIVEIQSLLSFLSFQKSHVKLKNICASFIRFSFGFLHSFF